MARMTAPRARAVATRAAARATIRVVVTRAVARATIRVAATRVVVTRAGARRARVALSDRCTWLLNIREHLV